MALVDAVGQPVQRAKDRQAADRHCSGKKKRHILKSQVAVDEVTGQVVDIAQSAPGPTADIALLKDSDIEYNRAFARRRVPVERTIGQMSRYHAVTQVDRHHRQHHTARVRAVAGLVDRQVKRWEASRPRQAA